VTPNTVAALGGSAANDSTTWWQELPATGFTLMGRGAAHDTSHVYVYAFDTLSAQGQANLTQVRRIDTTDGYPFVGYRDTARGSPAEMYRRVTQLTRTALSQTGAKEFALVVHMKGRYFGEDRWYVSTSPDTVAEGGIGVGLPRREFRHLYMAFWPPRVLPLNSESPYYVRSNGDTAGAVFILGVDAVYGGGYGVGTAAITRADLIVAAKPSSLAWDYRSWNSTTVPPISLQELLALPHEVFPPAAGQPGDGAVFYLVSTAGWPSGEYLIGIITADQFGNQGFAPMPFDAARYTTNPFVVTVLSGS
jgi:hypothetical protein